MEQINYIEFQFKKTKAIKIFFNSLNSIVVEHFFKILNDILYE